MIDFVRDIFRNTHGESYPRPLNGDAEVAGVSLYPRLDIRDSRTRHRDKRRGCAPING